MWSSRQGVKTSQVNASGRIATLWKDGIRVQDTRRGERWDHGPQITPGEKSSRSERKYVSLPSLLLDSAQQSTTIYFHLIIQMFIYVSYYYTFLTHKKQWTNLFSIFYLLFRNRHSSNFNRKHEIYKNMQIK